jgi:hypothetical protein
MREIFPLGKMFLKLISNLKLLAANSSNLRNIQAGDQLRRRSQDWRNGPEYIALLELCKNALIPAAIHKCALWMRHHLALPVRYQTAPDVTNNLSVHASS